MGKRHGDPTPEHQERLRRERVEKDGSTLGNIARERGFPNIGRIMDEKAAEKGDVEPKGPPPRFKRK